MRGPEKVAELTLAIGYYLTEDLLDKTAAESGHIYSLLLAARGWNTRTLRKILEAKGPPRRRQEGGAASRR